MTCRAVEKPGTKMRFITSRRESSRTASAVASPRCTATSRTRSSSIPAPSSSTTISTWLPFCSAASRTRPARGFPARARASGGSMAWSIALRMRCISGSERSSTMSLSSSTSPPDTSRSISLPTSRAIFRTIRASLSKTCSSGTIRTSRMPACSSASFRSRPRFAPNSSDDEGGVAALRLQPLREPVERRLHEHELADEVHQPVELADVDAHRLRDRAERGRVVAPAARARARGSRERAGRARRPRPRRAARAAARASSRRRATGWTTAVGPASRCTAPRPSLAGEEELERDRLRVPGVGRGQRRDHLADALQPPGERGELPVERRRGRSSPARGTARPPSPRWRGAGAPRTR